MSSSSHIKCRNCGTLTHSRNNSQGGDLCWKCWRSQGAPLLKAERQRIKMSRRKRRQAERMAELHNGMVSPMATSLVMAAKAAAEEPATAEFVQPLPGYVEHVREAVEQLPEPIALVDEPVELPKPEKTGTPEWAAWVRQFIGKPRLTPEQEDEIVVMLKDPEIPHTEIQQAYGVGAATLTRLKQKHGIPPRDRGLSRRLANERKKEAQLALPEGVEEGEGKDMRIHVQRKQRHGVLMSGQGVMGSAQQMGGTQAWLVGQEQARDAPDIGQEQAEDVPDTDQEQEQSVAERKGRRPAFTPDEEAAIVDRYTAGEPIASIAQEAGRAESSLYRVLQLHNVPLRQKRGNSARPTAPPPLAVVDGALPPVLMERAWIVAYTVSSQRMLNAPSIEEALRRIKEELGGQVEIRSINPA